MIEISTKLCRHIQGSIVLNILYDLLFVQPLQQDVCSWLSQLKLEVYEQNFIEGGFDDIDFLKDIDKNDLDMIEIKKIGHQKKILMAVQELRNLELTAALDQVIAGRLTRYAYMYLYSVKSYNVFTH